MKEILDKIKPSNEEQKKFKTTIKEFLHKLNSEIKDAQLILGGSGAKDTWLSGNHDIDIFVMFPYQKYSKKSLSEIVEKKLRKTFPKIKINLVHGSRDYFQLFFQDFQFEIVPILKINSAKKAINITDISPLHSAWVNKNAKKVKDEIRLAKMFCIAHNLYGAESYIGGFSGYVLEIMTTHYGSFTKMLQASQKWKVSDVIDTAKMYPKKDAAFHINKSKLQSPLIVIDPVDRSRNAAAALSTEKFISFKKTAKQYLKKPKVSFFNSRNLDFTELQKEVTKKKQNLAFIEPLPLVGKEDVIGFKLKKAFHFLEKELEQFIIKKSGWEWNRSKKAVFYFILQKKEVPKFTIREGPPLKMKDFVANFKKKHRKTFTKDGKIYAKFSIDHPKLEDFLQNSLKNKYFKEKIKKVSRVRIV